ncbi:hypothetical protein [Microbacterium phyllosphaerae]|uniref:hypothetical protein n=1 Tax=Microbacterium phyllosphaerae TaxID=124798 RepID=UPI000EA2FCAE|nr:hypothetical protein [Microbacterium phyllosphaerae]
MTFYGPFAQVASDGQKGWLTDDYRPISDQLRRMLGLLDSKQEYTYSIWRGADPTNIVGFREPANDYFIQAAGSADAMTVEVRLPGPDGEGHLYTVGRPESADGTTTLIPISDRRAVRVSSNEVFTADEAAVIFHTYYLTDAVSQPYVLRELDLSNELSEER